MYVCDIMQKMYKELVGMIKNLQIIRVNTNYCDYLRKFDSRVAYNMNEKKEIRPFCRNIIQDRRLRIFCTTI